MEVIADKRYASIAVRVEGEHDSAQEYVLKYGARLGDILNGLKLTQDADLSAIQLYRDSVKVRQKEMLNSSLKALEASILTARSSSEGEAKLRNSEAQLLMQWVERAKDIQPNGQVVLANGTNMEDVRLEPGDIIRIPRQTNLIMVHGDVMFPNAILMDSKRTVADYIDLAGGFTQKASNSRILLLHRDGTFSQIEKGDWTIKRLPSSRVTRFSSCLRSIPNHCRSPRILPRCSIKSPFRQEPWCSCNNKNRVAAAATLFHL